MCYPKPGPRCSAHARQALDSALADVETALDAGDHDAYITAREAVDSAQEIYDRTTEGIASLKADGEHELANQYEQERAEAVEAYKKSLEPVAPVKPEALTGNASPVVRKTAKATLEAARAVDNALSDSTGLKRDPFLNR